MSQTKPVPRAQAGDVDVRSVVVLTPWFPNVPGDRNGSYIYESAAALARKGVCVSVLVCRPGVPAVPPQWVPEWARGKIEVGLFGDLQRVVPIRYFALPGGALRRLSNFSQRRSVMPALEAVARQARASIIHAQTEGMAPIAVEVARKLALPAVVTIHGVNTDQNYLHSRSQKAVLGRALRECDRVVLVGSMLKDVFVPYVGRGDHMRVVPNGVRPPIALRRTEVLSRAPLRLVSVSNLHEGKGIDLALDALALLDARGMRDWTYKVIGDGAERNSLVAQARARNLSDRVNFLGERPPRVVMETLLESDVFMLPSYREAFGIAYLEAMSCALPTIGVRGQGPEDFIEHGVTGLLIEPRSASAIADCLQRILADPEEARRIGERARIRAQAFDWDAHADRLMGVFNEALSARP